MKNRPTLAIYGIKDRNRLEYPAYTHDHNLCLMQGGKILQYLQLERYTRRKYDNRLDEFLEELVESNQLQLPNEFDFVSVNSFVGSSFHSKTGKFLFEAVNSKTLVEGLENAFGYYQYKDWEGRELNAYNCSQELAHIGSCLPFFGNFKENSLLIHFDGASSVSNFSAFHHKNGKLNLLEFGWDLKFIANFFNDNAFTFKILGARPGEHCSVPGKLMGYACLGKYDEKIESWLKNNSYFKENWSDAEAILHSINSEFGRSFSTFDNRDVFFQDVAATLQRIFEREIISKVENIQKNVKANYLYYTGGCALNIVANTKLIKRSLFKDVFIPPCCNDGGLSIGAAAFAEWQKGNNILTHSAYLNSVGINYTSNPITEEVIHKTAEILLAKGVVGICNGNGEAGPRALGNRSLIALANDKSISKRLSMEVKKREWYRPVAPVMLHKIAQTVVRESLHHLSKYMLLDFEIKNEFANELIGVIHGNNTARIQTISNEGENPFMFKLLEYLYAKQGILGLINTSFNEQGEPIVHTPEMAMQSARRMNLNGLIINNQLYKL